MNRLNVLLQCNALTVYKMGWYTEGCCTNLTSNIAHIQPIESSRGPNRSLQHLMEAEAQRLSESARPSSVSPVPPKTQIRVTPTPVASASTSVSSQPSAPTEPVSSANNRRHSVPSYRIAVSASAVPPRYPLSTTLSRASSEICLIS